MVKYRGIHTRSLGSDVVLKVFFTEVDLGIIDYYTKHVSFQQTTIIGLSED